MSSQHNGSARLNRRLNDNVPRSKKRSEKRKSNIAVKKPNVNETFEGRTSEPLLLPTPRSLLHDRRSRSED